MADLKKVQDAVDQTLATFPDEMSCEMKKCYRYNMINKYMRNKNRWCPTCGKKYELKGHEENSDDLVESERFLSGICSTRCYEILTGPDCGYSQGKEAKQTTVLTDEFENGKAQALGHVWPTESKIKMKEKKKMKKEKKKKKKGWNSGFLL